MSLGSLGEIATASAQGAAQGVASMGTDVIRALYDVLGAYPRADVLPYWYGFTCTSAAGNALSALGTSTQTIRVSADAPFIATKIVGVSTADYSILMRIAGSDRQLSNVAVHSGAFVGTAERPNILPKPIKIEANSTVSFDLADLSNATNEVYFYLGGFKVYNL